MGAFLTYSIISGLLMLAMYLAYRLFLARDNQHGFNRGILLLIYFVAFLTLPAISFFEKIELHSHAGMISVDGFESTGGATATLSQPIWGTVLIWIFMTGMVVVALKTVITWSRLTGVIRSGKKIYRDGYILVITDDERFAPFSWMHYVVISRSDYDNNSPAITTHELKHVACHHWVDLLIAQVVCVTNWFNPASWLMRDELMLIHEYQADMAVIDSGHDTQEYQMLLIKKAVGARFPSLANSLNHSKLKKRITMMYKEKSCVGRRFKALALVPVLALTLGVAGIPAVRAAVSTISSSEVSIGKDSKNPSHDIIAVQRYKVTNINNDGSQTTVTVRGEGLGNNLTVSGGKFTNNGKTFNAGTLLCSMTDDVATITATFPFSDKYKDAKMTLTVNGMEVPFNLECYFNDLQAEEKNDCQTSIKVYSIVATNNSPLPTYYLDGKEILELNKINPEDIESITVNKQDNSIRITSKK